MKKVGILTINDYNNYGNRLQNYAVQEVLKKIGCNPKTIVNKNLSKNTIVKKNFKERIKNKSINDLLKRSIYKTKNKILYRRIKETRIKVFKEFTKKNIIETEFSISSTEMPQNLPFEYDYFITGSDQVWNPNFRYDMDIDFLTFAPPEKRIAYAPSFGISEIPTNLLGKYKIWLNNMAALSVREHAGAKIIKDLTGRDAVVLIDPTLMLNKSEWLTLSKGKTIKLEKDYLLTYFLGGINRATEKKIREVAKKYDLKIINLAQIKSKTLYKIGPDEFINYINSAKVLFTDSFHGAVFSILLETPFVVFERESNIPSMNSRIDTLLSTFKLESRLEKNIKSNSQIFDIDLTHTKSILDYERKKSLDFLRQALKL
jgi:hypothetical protein